MAKDKKALKELENAENADILEHIITTSQATDSNSVEMAQVEVRMSMLTLAKDILERNAALQWEQDKTKGLTISCETIICEAKKLLDFVFEDIS